MTKKISALTAAGSFLLADEMEVNEAGTSKKVTGTQIKTTLRIGTTTNDDAAAGSIGEYIESEVLSGSAVSLTSGSPADITTISLTAGDWEVWGTTAYTPNALTTMSRILGWISTTSATLPATPNKGALARINATFETGATLSLPVGRRRYSLASTTTIYLTCTANFAVNTLGGFGIICARRVR